MLVVLVLVPALALAPTPAPSLEPDHLAGLARRLAQLPTPAALGSAKGSVGAKGLEPGRASEWAAAEGSEQDTGSEPEPEPEVETPVGRSSIRSKG